MGSRGPIAAGSQKRATRERSHLEAMCLLYDITPKFQPARTHGAHTGRLASRRPNSGNVGPRLGFSIVAEAELEDGTYGQIGRSASLGF